MTLPKPDQDTLRTIAYLRIWLTPGIGTRGAHRLLELIRRPERIDTQSPEGLRHAGFDDDVARTLVSTRSRARAEEEWDRAQALGARIIDIEDPSYPRLLRETADPPLILYIRGRVWDPPQPHIGIIGSRKPTEYGINCAERIARDLAERAVVVVSGLARGIDTAAHRGALAGGATLAVLGTGIDRVYPAENDRIAESIAASGALVTEYPLGTLPLPQNFPRRNRILAGLALATLVVEAAERSGSLITARFALEANREVFAVPGPVHSPKSRGCHQLIQQGACLVTGWQDVARELSPGVELVTPGTEAAQTPTPKLPLRQLAILQRVPESEAVSFDSLLAETSSSVPELASVLLALELGGLVRRVPGDRYIRSHALLPDSKNGDGKRL